MAYLSRHILVMNVQFGDDYQSKVVNYFRMPIIIMYSNVKNLNGDKNNFYNGWDFLARSVWISV